MFNKIISIHGVPRSGTTWLGQILNSDCSVRYKYQPLFSFAFKGRITLQSKKNDVEKYFEELYLRKNDFLDQIGQIQKGYSPNFIEKEALPKTLMTKMVRYHYLIPHFLQIINPMKFVCIIRNPLAVLNSFQNSPQEFNQDLNFLDEWYYAQTKNYFRPEEYFGFAKWKEYVKLVHVMKEQFPERIYILRYEDLLKDTLNQTQKIFTYADLTINQQTIDFIKKSTSVVVDDVYSVYKGKKNNDEWKSQLDSKIIERVNQELNNTEFVQYLEK